MIHGSGIDIIEIERIERVIAKHGQRFLDRLFTQKEQEYCQKHKVGSAARYAGRWAAKEAVIKALGKEISPFSWKEIEIHNTPLGRPYVQLFGRLAFMHDQKKITLSISHDKHMAVAVAFIEN